MFGFTNSWFYTYFIEKCCVYGMIGTSCCSLFHSMFPIIQFFITNSMQERQAMELSLPLQFSPKPLYLVVNAKVPPRIPSIHKQWIFYVLYWEVLCMEAHAAFCHLQNLTNNTFSAWDLHVYDTCLLVVHIWCVVCKPLKVNSLSWVRPRQKMCEIKCVRFALNEWHSVKAKLRYQSALTVTVKFFSRVHCRETYGLKTTNMS